MNWSEQSACQANIVSTKIFEMPGKHSDHSGKLGKVSGKPGKVSRRERERGRREREISEMKKAPLLRRAALKTPILNKPG